MPVVTQTTACFWSRPVAKALGMSTFGDRHLGLGHVGQGHRRSTTPCSWGACSRRDDLAPHRVEGDPVRVEVLDEQEHDRDDEDEDELQPDEEEHGDEEGV